MLCQHNILGHSFLNAFRNHKVLLTVDPAAQRGLLPTSKVHRIGKTGTSFETRISRCCKYLQVHCSVLVIGVTKSC